jgi:hypothetical protein
MMLFRMRDGGRAWRRHWVQVKSRGDAWEATLRRPGTNRAAITTSRRVSVGLMKVTEVEYLEGEVLAEEQVCGVFRS